MKKLMFGLVGALAMVAGAEVESGNVVGYNSVTKVMGGQMNLLCVSWAEVGNASGKATLNDVMDISKLTSYSEDGDTAGDYINTWNMNTGNWGTTYYYVDQAVAWDDPSYASTWMDGDFVPCNPDVDPGSAFWLKAVNDINDFAIRGEVVTDGVAYTLTAGQMNLCANPYPAELNLNDKNQVVITGMTSYSEDGDTAGDYINTWNLATANWGTTYYYVDQAVAWDDAAYADTWMDGDFVPVDNPTIGLGSGFWYNAKGTVTLTFTSPLDK